MNLVLIFGSCALPRGSRFYQGFGASHLQDVADPQLSIVAIRTTKDRANIEERIATCGRSPLIIWYQFAKVDRGMLLLIYH